MHDRQKQKGFDAMASGAATACAEKSRHQECEEGEKAVALAIYFLIRANKNIVPIL